MQRVKLSKTLNQDDLFNDLHIADFMVEKDKLFAQISLDDDELAIWQRLTGRETAPSNAADELWLAMGRRGGKSFIAAFLAVLIA